MSSAIDKAAKILDSANRGFFVAQYEQGDGIGVHTRYRGHPNALLGIYVALINSILNQCDGFYEKEDVLKSLRESLEKTIILHKWGNRK